jgi:hypothetical protein
VRARASYRNNAVAPASLDPTDDAALGGKKCPPDYHLMGADDNGLDFGGTLYARHRVSLTISPPVSLLCLPRLTVSPPVSSCVSLAVSPPVLLCLPHVRETR